MSLRVALWFVLLTTVATAVSAQTVPNPTRVTFRASADHNATSTDNSTTPPTVTPLVNHYELQFSLMSGPFGMVFTANLGKPTPGAPVPPATVGDITFVFAGTPIENWLTATAQKNTIYRARSMAVGVSGTGASADSNPFVQCPCSPTVPPLAPGAPAIQ